MDSFGHIINGEEVESADGQTMDSVDPYTQEPWARAALGGAADAERAVAAAREAFDEGPWPRMGYAERQAALHRLADTIEAHARELADADSHDMGKTITDAMHADVPRSARNFRFFADHAAMATGEALPSDTGHHIYTRFEPTGVVAAIAPWNFPLMLETWKVAPALAWGNTVVLKPAEDTPASATILGRLAIEAGLPPGVLNVVHGYGPDSAGQALTESKAVDRITFTGESGTGKIIMRAASDLMLCSLELGGKGANIVFADADLDNAVTWSIKAIFHNAGQVCLAGSRLFVQRAVYDEFLDRFVAAAEALKLGAPGAAGTDMGPLASQEHYGKVRSYVEGVGADGGKVRTGGMGDGWFCKPTVIVDAPPEARVVREKRSSVPVVVQQFNSEAEAVARANGTPFGLNAMVFTEDLSRAHRVSAALNAGTVWVNCFFIRDLRAPFGGFGESGVGREGGNFSREFFTEPKAVVMQLSGAEKLDPPEQDEWA